MKFYSPLEQFDITYIMNIKDNIILSKIGIDLFISNLGLYLIIIIIIIILLSIYINIGEKKNNNQLNFFSNSVQIIYEKIMYFIIDMIQKQTGREGITYIPILFTTFIFILISNLLGMLPFGFTITGHLSITFFLALAFNLGFFFVGLFLHGFQFFKLFVPGGTPKVLLPLIVIIEILSYGIRTFSLSIRLFANMMAGHCLLYVISSFVFKLLTVSFISTIIPIILIYLSIFCLELAIAFLQAYVFTILLAIYINDSIHLGH